VGKHYDKMKRGSLDGIEDRGLWKSTRSFGKRREGARDKYHKLLIAALPSSNTRAEEIGHCSNRELRRRASKYAHDNEVKFGFIEMLIISIIGKLIAYFIIKWLFPSYEENRRGVQRRQEAYLARQEVRQEFEVRSDKGA
jgi:di/tricarboxylate transporter